MTEERLTVNRGYAVHRLERALESAEHHRSADVRKRARIKIDKWRAVLAGIANGNLTVGSRVPVQDTPAWVTLEVAHGGFATGRYLAEGALLSHELEVLATLEPAASAASERERLNLYYLTDTGQAELLDALRRGAYRLQVPEEGALMVVAWLMHKGHDVEALTLIDAVRGLMHRLRFYPALSAEPRLAGACVRVATCGEVGKKLRNAETRLEIIRMNATLAVWGPLYDRLVELWLTTVDGAPPMLNDDRQIEGGWPARRWPSNWIAQRARWFADYRAALQEHSAHGKHHRRNSNFSRLRAALERCPMDSATLTGREVASIRLALAATRRRYGAIDGERHTRLRAVQARDAARPLSAEVAQVVAERLEQLPADAGLQALEPVVRPVSDGESKLVPGGVDVPSHLAKKVERALEAPVAELIERGVIASSEVLALVLPQITAQIASAGIADPVARDLYAKIYAAFRSRRSLLLLDLAHQVQLDELPWVQSLAPFRSRRASEAVRARQALEDVIETALYAFGHAILPNRLVREMSGLAKQAKLDLPLVEEVAADIFMGTFTGKWARAAQVTYTALEGTLYARYYALPTPTGEGWLKTLWGKSTAPDFNALCARRAKEAQVGAGSRVAANGTVLEQSQILTSHNLAVLAEGLGLTERLSVRAPEQARLIFDWIRRRHSQMAPHWKARLQMTKNTAYAWRQAIYFLSLTDVATQRELSAAFLRDVEGSRLEPVAAGLVQVAEGGQFDARGLFMGDASARRFLGWSVGPHWMFDKRD